MSRLSQRLIFGRGIYTTHISDASALEEKKHNGSIQILLPSFSSKDYYDKWGEFGQTTRQPCPYTCIIVLELLQTETMSELQSIPVGVLVYTGSVDERNRLLQTCILPNTHLDRGKAQIWCLTAKMFSRMYSRFTSSATQRTFGLDDLWTTLVVDVMKGGNAGVIGLHGVQTNTWVCKKLLHNWNEKQGVKAPCSLQAATIDHKRRQLSAFEQSYVFFTVSLRYKRSTELPLSHLRQCVKNMTFPITCLQSQAEEDEYLSLKEKCGNMLEFGHLVIDLSHADLVNATRCLHSLCATLTASVDDYHETLMGVYNRYVNMVKQSQELFTNTLVPAMLKVRQETVDFCLYTSHQLQVFTEDSVCCVPSDLTNTSAVASWVHERSAALSTYAGRASMTDTLYSSIAPTIEYGSFRLYGNLEGRLASLDALWVEHRSTTTTTTTTTSNLVAPSRTSQLYVPERLGNMNTRSADSVPLYMSHVTRSNSPFSIAHATPTQQRLLECSELCTPIWAEFKPKQGCSYLRLLPMFNDTRKRTSGLEPAPMTELLKTHLYSDDDITGNESFTHEYIQSSMHWSSFAADVDIVPHAGIPLPNEEQTARDLAAMCETVFNRVFPADKARSVHVFVSRYKNNDTNNTKQNKKLGLHLYMRLPSDMVFTSVAAKQFAVVLEHVKQAYSDTLGIPTAGGKPIIDLVVYPTNKADGMPAGHCLRGPWQLKESHDGRLECLFSKGKPMDVHAKLVHGAHFIDADNDSRCDRVLTGRIVTSLGQPEDFTDVGFFRKHEVDIMSQNMATCVHTASAIMDEINKKSLLFLNKDEGDVKLLVQIINSIWLNSTKMQQHMREYVGADGRQYTRSQLDVINRCRFMCDDVNDKLYLTPDGTTKHLPFCIRRPHRNTLNKKMKVNVYVGYQTSMIRFVLFVSGCFKTSCKPGDGYFTPNIVLQMPDVYMSRSLLQDMMTFLRTKFCNHTVSVLDIREPEENAGYEDENEFWADDIGYEVINVAHNGAGIQRFLTISLFERDLQHVYVFVPRIHPVSCLLFLMLNKDVFMCMCKTGSSYGQVETCTVIKTTSTSLLCKYLQDNNNLLPPHLYERIRAVLKDV